MNRARSGFEFTNDKAALKCFVVEDYEGTVYDRGHLANAEDFAFDCEMWKALDKKLKCHIVISNENLSINDFSNKHEDVWKYSDKDII